MARKDPLLEPVVLIFLLPIALPILGLRLAYSAFSSFMNRKTLEAIVIENPKNIEQRKSEIAIQLNINADAFEDAWGKVATKYPQFFPVATSLNEIHTFSEAIRALLNSPKKIVTKTQVAQLSGLSREKVEELWPNMHKHGSFTGGFIEDEPPKPRLW